MYTYIYMSVYDYLYLGHTLKYSSIDTYNYMSSTYSYMYTYTYIYMSVEMIMMTFNDFIKKYKLKTKQHQI